MLGDIHYHQKSGFADVPVACVVGVSNGGGEQLGRGGRELDLDYKVYKLKTNLSWGWARRPIPTLICVMLALSSPPSLPPSCRCVLGSCLGPLVDMVEGCGHSRVLMWMGGSGKRYGSRVGHMNRVT